MIPRDVQVFGVFIDAIDPADARGEILIPGAEKLRGGIDGDIGEAIHLAGEDGELGGGFVHHADGLRGVRGKAGQRAAGSELAERAAVAAERFDEHSTDAQPGLLSAGAEGELERGRVGQRQCVYGAGITRGQFNLQMRAAAGVRHTITIHAGGGQAIQRGESIGSLSGSISIAARDGERAAAHVDGQRGAGPIVNRGDRQHIADNGSG